MKKNKKLLAFVTAFVFSLVFSILFKWIRTGNPIRFETVIYGSVVFVNAIVLLGIASRFFGRLTRIVPTELGKKLLPAYLLFVLIALVVSLMVVTLGVFAGYLAMGIELDHFVENLFRIELPSALKQFGVWILMGSAFFFYLIWRKSLDREQKLLAENLRYKYRNLKSRVNPHFLFNSLNTLSELVHEDSAQAESYIEKLSSIYRYVLENEEKDLVGLEEELTFTRDFFSLQEERDRGKIILDINVPNPQVYRVIPTSLQGLVENALKHNARSGVKPLRISLTLEKDELIVRNNLQKKTILEEHSGTGLAGLKEKVSLIMRKEVQVREDKDKFVVSLPLDKNENENTDN